MHQHSEVSFMVSSKLFKRMSSLMNSLFKKLYKFCFVRADNLLRLEICFSFTVTLFLPESSHFVPSVH